MWQREAGEGFSTPVVAQGRVILFHRIGDKDRVESLEAATGKSQWVFEYPANYRDDFGLGDGPRAAPAVDGGRVFTYGAQGMLHCLDLNSGKKIWALNAREKFGVRKEFFGAACSPLVDGDRVLMNIGGAENAGIVALNKLDGSVFWKSLTDEAGYSAPTLITIHGERHALFFTRNGLVDADPATGKLRFQFPWRSRQHASANAATPLAAGGLVFLSASYNTGATVLEITPSGPKQIWASDDALSNHYATSVLKDGFLYGFHGRQEFGQQLRCVEMRTGKVMWSVEGFGAGTVTLARDHLFVLRESGELQIAPATPKEYKAARKAQLLPGAVRAYPAVSGGRMYVRNENTLAAFRID